VPVGLGHGEAQRQAGRLLPPGQRLDPGPDLLADAGPGGIQELKQGAVAVGFGLAGLVVFRNAGEDGAAGYALLVLGSLLVTAVFLSIAALISAGAVGRKRARALALALVVWFVAVLLLDLVALGVASLLRSTAASRVLILSVLVNPASAMRTGALLGIEGTAAFGSGSLALLRFTGGATGAAALIVGSLATWIVLPALVAIRRLTRADL